MTIYSLTLKNLARVYTASTGTGATITLGAAVSGSLTFTEAGVVDGATVRYGISDSAKSEQGTGVWDATLGTMTRTVLASTNSGNRIDLSGNAQVFITPAAEDFAPLPRTPEITAYLTGSGTYTTPTGATYLVVEMVGGGAGGQGNGTSAAGDTAGGTTSFDTYSVTGGAIAGGTGGSSTGTAPDISVGGGNGAAGDQAITSNVVGGAGGVSYYGGNGQGIAGSLGPAARSNSGSGGAAAASIGAFIAGTGGSAGGWLRATIGSPAATYAYSVGAAGVGGTAGAGGLAGGNGGAGRILVTAYFN